MPRSGPVGRPIDARVSIEIALFAEGIFGMAFEDRDVDEATQGWLSPTDISDISHWWQLMRCDLDV